MYFEMDNGDTTASDNSLDESDDNITPRSDVSSKSARSMRKLLRRPTCIRGMKEDRSKREPKQTILDEGVKKDNSKTGLKEQLKAHRRTIAKLRYEIQVAQQEKDDLRNILMDILSKHESYYVSNLQIGDNCSMVAGADNTALFEATREVENLIRQLTTALKSDMEKRAKLEMKSHNIEIQLKELNEKISELCKNVPTQTKTENDSEVMVELNESLKDLQVCRSDESLMGECLVALKSTTETQCFVARFECLPPKAQPGISRLVNKFGSITWRKFATQLELDHHNINPFPKCDSYQEDPDHSDKLDKNVCATILVEWINKHGVDVDKFLQLLEKMQQKMFEGLQRKYKKEVNGPIAGSGRYRDSLPSRASSESIISHTEYVTTRTERIQRISTGSMNDEGQLKELVDMVRTLVKAVPHNTGTILEGISKKLDDIYEDRLCLK